jgi:NCAIR mutase (PurE)-related protein
VNRDRIQALLERLKQGEVETDHVVEELARLPFREIAGARVDTHRALRTGIPEVIYAPGKTTEQVTDIVRALQEAGQNVLVTRIEATPAARVQGDLEAGEYEPIGRTLWFGPAQVATVGKGTIAVVSAGTADLPVATEAATVARCFGNEVEVLGDVGVAGIHRLLAANDLLRSARVLIVVAGMEGALPSVVGGMVDKPVIGVPTSVGYGAAFGGVAALLGMLTSCASNVTVVNIDNGFGAAYVATLINRL